MTWFIWDDLVYSIDLDPDPQFAGESEGATMVSAGVWWWSSQRGPGAAFFIRGAKNQGSWI